MRDIDWQKYLAIAILIVIAHPVFPILIISLMLKISPGFSSSLFILMSGSFYVNSKTNIPTRSKQ